MGSSADVVTVEFATSGFWFSCTPAVTPAPPLSSARASARIETSPLAGAVQVRDTRQPEQAAGSSSNCVTAGAADPVSHWFRVASHVSGDQVAPLVVLYS